MKQQFPRKIIYSLFAAFLCAVVLHNAGAEEKGLYVNLRDVPLYVKAGFSLADTVARPDSGSGVWKEIPPGGDPVQINALGLAGVPKRRFLDPRGAEEMTVAFVIPFAVSGDAVRRLKQDVRFIPGIFLASLGDNWEVFLNGNSIMSEIHLDGRGKIASHRNYHHIYFPFDKNFIAEGENILAFKIIGDPTFNEAGFFRASPYYIGDYREIVNKNSETVALLLIGVYLFMGLYHLFMYLLRRKDLNNLFYGCFSLILGIYFLVRTRAIYEFLPDRNSTFRIELFAVITVIPATVFFMEYLSFKKLTIIAKTYAALAAVMALLTLFFSLPFADDLLRISQIIWLGMLAYILVYDVFYGLAAASRRLKVREAARGKTLSGIPLFFSTLGETSIGSVFAGVIICAGTAIYDILDSLVFNTGIMLTQFGFLIFTVGSAMILARRYAFFYKQQERIIQRSNKGMNTRLVDWIVVQDRDPREMPSLNANHAIMFTDVRNFTRLSEGMPSEILIRFLGTLNEVLAKPLFDAEDSGGVAYTDKFMGDGMMNIFTDAETALRTAVKVRSLLDDFNANPGAYWNEAKFKLRVDVGVGIAYGPVTVGVMGHSRRIDYTPIGDTVNLASRLEGMTKEYHTPIIINEDLRAAIRNQDAFHIRFLDRIRVKGKEHPVTIYEEYSLNSPAIRDAKKHFENDLQELQERYFSGDWKNAMSLAREIIRKYEEICRNYGLGDAIADHLPIIYLKRMEAIQRNPDRFKNWDGVYSFETK